MEDDVDVDVVTVTIGEKLRWLAGEVEKGEIEEFDLGWTKKKEKLWGVVFIKTAPDELTEVAVNVPAVLKVPEAKKSEHPF